MKQKLRSNKGFTLIELVIVIAIIGILAGTAFVLLRPQETLSKARNTARVKDISTLFNSLSNALGRSEIVLLSTGAKGSNGRDSSTNLLATSGKANESYITFDLASGTAATFKLEVNKLPKDPMDGTIIPGRTSKYRYVYCSDGKDFELNAYLENDESAKQMSTDGGDNDNAYELGTNLSICPDNVF